jgi:hypothetical protein
MDPGTSLLSADQAAAMRRELHAPGALADAA